MLLSSLICLKKGKAYRRSRGRVAARMEFAPAVAPSFAPSSAWLLPVNTLAPVVEELPAYTAYEENAPPPYGDGGESVVVHGTNASTAVTAQLVDDVCGATGAAAMDAAELARASSKLCSRLSSDLLGQAADAHPQWVHTSGVLLQTHYEAKAELMDHADEVVFDLAEASAAAADLVLELGRRLGRLPGALAGYQAAAGTPTTASEAAANLASEWPAPATVTALCVGRRAWDSLDTESESRRGVKSPVGVLRGLSQALPGAIGALAQHLGDATLLALCPVLNCGVCAATASYHAHTHDQSTLKHYSDNPHVVSTVVRGDADAFQVLLRTRHRQWAALKRCNALLQAVPARAHSLCVRARARFFVPVHTNLGVGSGPHSMLLMVAPDADQVAATWHEFALLANHVRELAAAAATATLWIEELRAGVAEQVLAGPSAEPLALDDPIHDLGARHAVRNLYARVAPATLHLPRSESLDYADTCRPLFEEVDVHDAYDAVQRQAECQFD